MPRSRSAGVLVALGLLGSGCWSAHPIAPSEYLVHGAALEEGTVFASEYRAPDANLDKYSKVQIKGLAFGYLRDREQFDPRILRGMSDRFRDETDAALDGSFETIFATDDPDASTLVIEGSLRQIDEPTLWVNWITVWIPGSLSKGGGAIEIRMLDGASGEAVVEVAERQEGASGIEAQTIGGLMPYQHTNAALADWARKLERLLVEAGE